MFTGEKYPVHVDYSAPYPTGVQVEAQDIPTDFGGSNFSTPKTGSADINIELVMIRGANQSAMDDPVKIRDEIASSPSFSGYRFATAAELVALMETYKDQFNDIMAFGSINIGCGYYPWLWKKSSVMPGSVSGIMGRPVGSGPTNYSDMRRLGECMPTGENANGSSFYSSADLSSCTTNLRLWDWKFALVKI